MLSRYPKKQPAGPTQCLAPRFSCGGQRVGAAVGFSDLNHSLGMSWSRKKTCYVNLTYASCYRFKMVFSPVDGLLSAINYPRWVYLWASKMRGLRWYDHLKYTQRITEIDPLCHDCALNNWYGHIFFVLETAIFGTVFASSTATMVHSGDEPYK